MALGRRPSESRHRSPETSDLCPVRPHLFRAPRRARPSHAHARRRRPSDATHWHTWNKHMPIAARFMDTVAGPVDCPRHTSYCAVAAMKERLAVTRTSHMRPHGASAELRPPRRASALLRALLEQRHRIGRIAAGPGLRAHLDRNRQRVGRPASAACHPVAWSLGNRGGTTGSTAPRARRRAPLSTVLGSCRFQIAFRFSPHKPCRAGSREQ